MNADTARLLRKAARAIHAAETLLKAGDADFAIGRAYYAMFYTATALLEEHGFRVRKHTAAHGLFGEHFTKTGRLDPKFHRWLLDAFDRRLEGDYSFEAQTTTEDTTIVIAQATEFLATANTLLNEDLP